MSETKPTNGQPQPGPSSPLVQQPQYQLDYTGMATEPFPEAARRILAETPKHEDVEVKPDGICFMPGVWYRQQLTRAFGAGGWALRPTGPARTIGNDVEWPGALYALGRFVAEAVGGQKGSAYMSHADAIQGAKTDCLSKCCGHGLAMASELWTKTWREAWMEEYCETYTEKDGKTRYRLKKRRDPKAADLMRDVPIQQPTGASTAQPASKDGQPTTNSSESQVSLPIPTPASAATTPGTVPAPTATTAPASIASVQAAKTTDSAPPVVIDPITANARKAVKGQMKRLGFTAPEAKTWLTKYFGVAKVDMLDDTFQLDDAHDLLTMLSPDDQDPPAKYTAALDNLHANGRVLSK